jgi:hypothetical protein
MSSLLFRCFFLLILTCMLLLFAFNRSNIEIIIAPKQGFRIFTDDKEKITRRYRL